MKYTYTPPADQNNQRISIGIYNAECLSVIDGTSNNGNLQIDLECQVKTMKLRFRLILKDTVAWKIKQTRRAFGFSDTEGAAVSFDTTEFVGKSALCLVGYGEKLAQSGDPYLELIEFVEAGKEAAAETKLAQIIAAEKARKNGVEVEDADVIPF
jgi:hypothetical protein